MCFVLFNVQTKQLLVKCSCFKWNTLKAKGKQNKLNYRLDFLFTIMVAPVHSSLPYTSCSYGVSSQHQWVNVCSVKRPWELDEVLNKFRSFTINSISNNKYAIDVKWEKPTLEEGSALN